MWNKIYTTVLGICFVVLTILTYYSYTWLQSPTNPADVVLNYNYYSNISWMFLLASSVTLLVLGNVVLWTIRNAWAIWASFLYFAVFILLQTFWLGENFNRYKQQNGLDSSAVSLGALVGVILVGLAVIIVFFNQYLVRRMSNKMDGRTENESVRPSDVNSDSI